MKQHFQINSKTGEIKGEIQAIDREICEKYEFEVSVTEIQTNYHNATILVAKNSIQTAKLMINLIDQNDNEPKFTQEIYDFKLRDTKKFNNFFGCVTALDMDKPNTPYSIVNYAIQNIEFNDIVEGVFKINQTTGQLIQLQQLDAEKKINYYFNIIAYDNFNITGSLNTTCLVRIDVIKTNSERLKLSNENWNDINFFHLSLIFFSTNIFSFFIYYLCRFIFTQCKKKKNLGNLEGARV